MEEQKSKNYRITSIKIINDSLLQITVDSLNTFYLRKNYLEKQNIIFDVEEELSQEEFEDCINAGLTFTVEKKAMEYLAKTEQSRFLLKKKLKKKEHPIFAIEKSLDYLELKGYLNDSRYAMAFLRNRSISHFEGRNRLLQELLQRGVEKKIAQEQIDFFFEEKDEIEICKKALEKLRRIGKKEEKIPSTLEKLGFSYRVFREIL